jgi:branched-chain amino acid transport system permease protein
MPRLRPLIPAVLALFGLLLVWQLERGASAYILSLAGFVGINIILAVSLNITNGFTGLFSLGHPAFMAIGGYLTAILTFPPSRKAMFLPDLPAWLAGVELHFLPALLLGGVLALCIALVIGVPVLRLKGHYLAVATIGFLIIVQVMLKNMEGLTRGPLGLNGLPPLTNLWWIYLFAVLTVFVAWKIKFSAYGRRLLAVRENDMAAQCLGVNLFFARIQALCIGAFFAGVAGGLWAHLITVITPNSFSLILAFSIVVMVVVGGSGSIIGSVFGAMVFTVLTEVFRPLEGRLELYGMSEVLMSLVLLGILILRPKGLFGTGEPSWLLPKEYAAPVRPESPAIEEVVRDV